MKIRLIVFDFNRTLYDKDNKVEMDGANEVIKKVKDLNIPICIVSRNEGEQSKQLVYNQAFFHYIDEDYYVDGDNKKEKYLEAIADFKVTASEVLVVGDYLEKDIKPALELGCITVWFKHGLFASKTPSITGIWPDHIVSSLTELIPLLKKVQ